MQQLGEWEEGNLTAALDKNLLSRFNIFSPTCPILPQTKKYPVMFHEPNEKNEKRDGANAHAHFLACAFIYTQTHTYAQTKTR